MTTAPATHGHADGSAPSLAQVRDSQLEERPMVGVMLIEGGPVELRS